MFIAETIIARHGLPVNRQIQPTGYERREVILRHAILFSLRRPPTAHTPTRGTLIAGFLQRYAAARFERLLGGREYPLMAVRASGIVRAYEGRRRKRSRDKKLTRWVIRMRHGVDVAKRLREWVPPIGTFAQLMSLYVQLRSR